MNFQRGFLVSFTIFICDFSVNKYLLIYIDFRVEIFSRQMQDEWIARYIVWEIFYDCTYL